MTCSISASSRAFRLLGIVTFVDDMSQYFADYEDILNMLMVEDQQIVAQENTGEVYSIIYHLL